MTERAYTASEIIAMRESVRKLNAVPNYNGRAWVLDNADTATVERELVTYLQMAVDPDELLHLASQHYAKRELEIREANKKVVEAERRRAEEWSIYRDCVDCAEARAFAMGEVIKAENCCRGRLKRIYGVDKVKAVFCS